MQYDANYSTAKLISTSMYYRWCDADAEYADAEYADAKYEEYAVMV